MKPKLIGCLWNLKNNKYIYHCILSKTTSILSKISQAIIYFCVGCNLSYFEPMYGTDISARLNNYILVISFFRVFILTPPVIFSSLLNNKKLNLLFNNEKIARYFHGSPQNQTPMDIDPVIKTIKKAGDVSNSVLAISAALGLFVGIGIKKGSENQKNEITENITEIRENWTHSKSLFLQLIQQPENEKQLENTKIQEIMQQSKLLEKCQSCNSIEKLKYLKHHVDQHKKLLNDIADNLPEVDFSNDVKYTLGLDNDFTPIRKEIKEYLKQSREVLNLFQDLETEIEYQKYLSVSRMSTGSGSLIAAFIRPLASAGVAGAMIFKPGTLANIAATDCVFWAPACEDAPSGPRNTIGTDRRPPLR